MHVRLWAPVAPTQAHPPAAIPHHPRFPPRSAQFHVSAPRGASWRLDRAQGRVAGRRQMLGRRGQRVADDRRSFGW